jgi:predicted transcriptional regulator
MKKLLSISDNVALKLAQVAKEQNSTQSKIAETALVIYMMIHVQSKNFTNSH